VERVSAPFARYFEGLRAELTRNLQPLTLAFFGDLPAADAAAIAALIGGGKKIRGGVALAVCDALGGTIAAALPSAVAIECVHAASLIHDDFVDGDRTRRDRPATWTVQGARRAVLIGDVIFATALARSAEIGNEAVLALSRAIAMLAAGAYHEPLEGGDLRAIVANDAFARTLYERVIHLKTGALFGAAAELGAIAAKAPLGQRRAAFDFGAQLGEAFQIADDLEDAVSRDEAALSPPQRGTLATLVACFGARREAPTRDTTAGDLAPDPADDAVRIAWAMEAAIDRRVALMGEALDRFPARPRSRSLRCLPDVIIEPMIAAARRSRNKVAIAADCAR
jgi:geranylgeranyl diphosphate synthase, type I